MNMDVDTVLLALLLLSNGGGISAVLRAHAQSIRRLDWCCAALRQLAGELGHSLPEEPR